jgi:succinoglycan biosynthesis transport protein ExoP
VSQTVGSHGQITIKDLIGMSLRNWKVMVAVFLAFFIPVVIIAKTRPVEYKASAKILVENDRRANIELSGNLTERASRHVTPVETLNSQIELLKSRHILRHVVKILKLAETPEDQVAEVSRLKTMIEAHIIPSTSIIEVTYSDEEPDRAMNVVNTLVDVFLKYNIKMLEGGGAYDFYKDQYDQNKKKLEKFFAQLNDLRMKVGIYGNLEDEQKIIQTRLTTLEEKLINNKIEIDRTVAKIEVLKDHLAQQPHRIRSNIDKEPNPRVIELKEQLIAMEIELNRLLQVNSPDDRFVKYKKREIEKVKLQLEQLPEEMEVKYVSIVNPLYEHLNKELELASAHLEEMKRSRDKLTSEIALERKRFTTLNNYAYELTKLEQAVSIHTKKHREYVNKLETATFVENMNKANITTASIAEQAEVSLPQKSRFQNSLMLMLVLSIFISLAAAYMKERMRPVIISEDQIKGLLGLPVLATITSTGKNLLPLDERA